jgi:23S rRNA (uracil1939-C5)-methyltransferase
VSEAVRILRIAAGGDGVGRLADGRTVFIPRTAPGDEVEPTDIRLHARFARARIGRLLRGGPDRIEPPCRHYREDDCGGCQLQHLNAAAQVSARRTIVGDALRRIGKIDRPDPELETGPADLHYRAKITLTVDAGGTRAGFYRVDEATGVFDLERCEIADERLNQAWGALRSAARTWPPAVRQIVLRVGRDGAVHVVFRGPVRPDLTLLGSVGGFIWWEPPASAPAPVSELPDAAAIPPGVFEQVHPAMGERVRQWALDQLAVGPGQHVWDLYAGMGETSAALARAGATVESVELDREAVLVAERQPLAGVVRHAGRVEDWVGRLRSPDAVITNPPRTGMEGRALTGLLSAGPGVVVYISCDPATLARDLSRLRARYRVTAIRSFDLFPQTAHVETVVRLEQT